jgi:hypothetical protein
MASRLRALTVLCLLSIPGCSTLGIKTVQKIPVTANPPGARVIVDGEKKGTAPLILVLRRDQGHNILIEKEGYRRVLVRVDRRAADSALFDWGITIAGGVLGALAGGMLVKTQNDPEPLDLFGAEILGGLIGLGGVGYLVGQRETQYVLKPGELRITLEKVADGGGTDILVLSREQMESVRWIRIALADRPGRR